MKIAIITGASSGIGEEFAKQLNLTEGIEEFWFVARRRDRMEELAARLGVNAKITTADLTTDEGVDAVREALAEEKPEVKYLVNAAGFGKFGGYVAAERGCIHDIVLRHFGLEHRKTVVVLGG